MQRRRSIKEYDISTREKVYMDMAASARASKSVLRGVPQQITLDSRPLCVYVLRAHNSTPRT